VSSVTALVLKNTTLAPKEHCGSGSLLALQDAVKAKFNFSLTCIDDPTELFILFCPPGVVSAQCMAASLVYQHETSNTINHQTWAISATVVAGVLFILLVVVIIWASLKARKGYTSV
jgi:hypothetical protein